MKKIIFILSLFFTSFSVYAQIVINQVGYYPNERKQAVVVNGALNKDFRLVDAKTGKTVYEGKLSNPIQSKNSSLITRIADFSDYTAPGTYKVVAGQFETPGTINIAENVYQKTAKDVLRGFYYQRVSMPLEEKYAGKWARPSGHPDDKVVVHPSAATKKRPSGSIISSPGGWYDAGDYNKYIVNSGITMGTLMAAYEDFPDYFKSLSVNIPETGNGAPDLLNEITYNLRWMLTMQDPDDGGVYNKLTNASFDGLNAKPGETIAPRYVVQKGTTATLDFTAVMAQAARIYKEYNAIYPNLADSCLKAAKKSWEWAIKNPSLEYDQDKMNKEHEPVVSTGGYGDRNFSDEWFWAASEMYITTKDKKYKKIIDANYSDIIQIPSWGNVYLLGAYSLIRFNIPEYRTKLQALIIAKADEYVNAMGSSAFGVVMGKDKSDWVWGSSSVAANQGILLVNAYLITKNAKYLNAAATNVDYLLGKNATGYSFVTGSGYRPVMNIHHRPSVADNIVEPVPGLLSGGPNATASLSDGISEKNPLGVYYEFTEPETTFADHIGSYASNEIAINWNAPAVYLFNAIEAEQKNLSF